MKTEDLKISIIIPAYNSLQTIGFFFNSAPFDDPNIHEVLIVDSSDSTSWQTLNKMAMPYPKVRIIHLEEKAIPAISRNTGASEAEGNLLVFIDSDAYPDSGWIEAIKDAFNSGSQVGGGSIGLPDFQKSSAIATAQYYLQFNEFFPFYEKKERIFVPSCNLFCEKSLYTRTGGFPDIRASEDVMFGSLVGELSPMIFLPNSKVFHVFGTDWKRLLSNQRLLGKYDSIYRNRPQEGLFCYRTIQYVLSPLFPFYKYLLLSSRIWKMGLSEYLRFLKVTPHIAVGLIAWTRGYISGIAESEEKI